MQVTQQNKAQKLKTPFNNWRKVTFINFKQSAEMEKILYFKIPFFELGEKDILTGSLTQKL